MIIPLGLLSMAVQSAIFAVAAKNVMTSVPDYLAIETAFTLVQWMVVAPLTVLAVRRLAAGT